VAGVLDRELAARAAVPSALREGIAKRVSRAPLDVARLLAGRYPKTAVMSYIPAVAWINALRIGDRSLAERARQQAATLVPHGDEAAAARLMFPRQRPPLTTLAGRVFLAEPPLPA